MKKIRVKSYLTRHSTIFLLGLVFFLTACGPRMIPDAKMEAIIHDVFMANAYFSLYNKGGINVDSVDIYAPILERYGCDEKDFRYTLDRWALKKSSRLSELIDNATADIQKENQYYIARQQQQNRLDSLITEIYRDTVYMKLDSVWFRGRKYRDSLKLEIPLPGEGTYRLRYGYYVEAGRRSFSMLMRYNQKDSLDKEVYRGSRSLGTGTRREADVTFDYKSPATYLELVLAEYPANERTLAFRLDSLLLIHDAPIEKNRKRFLKDRIRLYTQQDYPYELRYPAKDSGSLYIVPPHRPDTACRTDI